MRLSDEEREVPDYCRAICHCFYFLGIWTKSCRMKRINTWELEAVSMGVTQEARYTVTSCLVKDDKHERKI